MIYEMGHFLTTKELFIFSRISSQWKKNLHMHKKKRIKKIQNEVSMSHYSNNICPCTLEHIFDQYMTDFFLKRYICRMISDKPVPDWFLKFVEKK